MVTEKQASIMASVACYVPHASATALFQQYLTNYVFKNKPVEMSALRAYISIEDLKYTDLVDQLGKDSKRLLLKNIFKYQYFHFMTNDPTIPFTSENFCKQVYKYLSDFGVESKPEGNVLKIDAENKKKWMDAIR